MFEEASGLVKIVDNIRVEAAVRFSRSVEMGKESALCLQHFKQMYGRCVFFGILSGTFSAPVGSDGAS